MILLIPKLINKKICEELIEIFHRNPDLHEKYGYTKMCDLNRLEDDDFITAKKSALIIERIASQTFGMVFIEYAQLVEWEKGSSMGLHTDDGREYTDLVSVTTLNDDYSGGEGYILEEDITVTPGTGKTVIFNGQEYNHSVKKVTDGNRYTLIIWYTKNISKAVTLDFNL